MKDIFSQLGLNEKEKKFYLYLLESGPKTASQVSKELEETRTNTYMVFKKLGDQKLIETSSSQGKVQTYIAGNPERLKNLISQQQQELRQTHMALSAVLPELNSMYRLGTHKPGAVYMEGIKGFKAFLEDINKSRQTVHLLASDIVPQVEEAWVLLEKETRKRASKGIKTKAIFHKQAKKLLDKPAFKTKGFELRFWVDKPLEGEVVVYGDKVAFTVYRPTIIVTVITNETLANTFLAVFQQLWDTAAK